MRHSAAGAPNFLAPRVRPGIVNAGDGRTQSSDAGAAGSLHNPGEERDAEGTERLHHRGHSSQPCRAQQHVGTSEAGGERDVRRTFHAESPRRFEKVGVRVCHNMRDALEGADVVNLLRIQHERQRSGFFPSVGEYSKVFGLNPGNGEVSEAGCADYASGADQPRCGAGLLACGRTAVGHS